MFRSRFGTSTHAECRALLMGLRMAWDQKWYPPGFKWDCGWHVKQASSASTEIISHSAHNSKQVFDYYCDKKSDRRGD